MRWQIDMRETFCVWTDGNNACMQVSAYTAIRSSQTPSSFIPYLTDRSQYLQLLISGPSSPFLHLPEAAAVQLSLERCLRALIRIRHGLWLRAPRLLYFCRSVYATPAADLTAAFRTVVKLGGRVHQRCPRVHVDCTPMTKTCFLSLSHH